MNNFRVILNYYPVEGVDPNMSWLDVINDNMSANGLTAGDIKDRTKWTRKSRKALPRFHIVTFGSNWEQRQDDLVFLWIEGQTNRCTI